MGSEDLDQANVQGERPMIELDALRRRLSYEPSTGQFRWLASGHGRKRGALAGCKTDEGYLTIRVERRNYRAHRLAWFYVYREWPAGQIDHINGDRADNRIANLRVVSHQQNQANRKTFRSPSTSQYRGVHKRGSKWRAQIRINQRTRHIGTFASEEDAAAAYVAVAKEAFGEHFATINADPMPEGE